MGGVYAFTREYAYRVNPVRLGKEKSRIPNRSILCRISGHTLPVVAVITVRREIRKCSVTRKGNRPRAKLANSPDRNPRACSRGRDGEGETAEQKGGRATMADKQK